MSTNLYQLTRVLESPLVSEKSTILAESERKIVFKVRKDATKTQVKQAVEIMFDVKVDSVNVLNVNGKEKRFGRTIGQRSDWKKAYVKLKEGHDIQFGAA